MKTSTIALFAVAAVFSGVAFADTLAAKASFNGNEVRLCSDGANGSVA